MSSPDKPKILTIEDSNHVRELIVNVLATQDYTLLQAASGRDGLELAMKDRPALILLDMELPDMDGFQVLQHVRKRKETSAIPVIVLTGRLDEGAKSAILQAGAQKYLTKPIKGSELIDEVRSIIREGAKGSPEETSQDAVEKSAASLAKQWNLPYLDVSRARLPRNAIELLDLEYLKSHQVLPLQLQSENLWLGVIDPLHVNILDEIRVITGYDVKPVVISETGLQRKLAELSQMGVTIEQGDVESPLAFVTPLEDEDSTHREQATYNLVADKQNVPVIRLVNTILEKGIELKASDIHIQPERKLVRVRYRIDGVMTDGPEVPRYMIHSVVARIRAMAGLDLATRRIPQDGRLSVQSGERRFELRVSIVTSVIGPKVVLRIAEQRDTVTTLENLGFEPGVLRQLRSIINRPHGLILATGPTGSGKSTTLYAALAELNDDSSCILTVENPVEMRIPGITQLEIHERSGLTFATCLRAALRQDPDIIMVGEIRDQETAMTATQASMTGHLVLSTLHTNDSASAVSRLIDMGIQPFLVGSSLMAVLAQRLVRRLCPKCSIPYQPIPEELASLEIDPAASIEKIRKPAGCSACTHTGYSGRMGIYELLTVSEPVRKLILQRRPDTDVRFQAVSEGMITLATDVRSKVLEGKTSLEEAHRIALF